jgi:hypothetical protein
MFTLVVRRFGDQSPKLRASIRLMFVLALSALLLLTLITKPEMSAVADQAHQLHRQLDSALRQAAGRKRKRT